MCLLSTPRPFSGYCTPIPFRKLLPLLVHVIVVSLLGLLRKRSLRQRASVLLLSQEMQSQGAAGRAERGRRRASVRLSASCPPRSHFSSVPRRASPGRESGKNVSVASVALWSKVCPRSRAQSWVRYSNAGSLGPEPKLLAIHKMFSRALVRDKEKAEARVGERECWGVGQGRIWKFLIDLGRLL